MPLTQAFVRVCLLPQVARKRLEVVQLRLTLVCVGRHRGWGGGGGVWRVRCVDACMDGTAERMGAWACCPRAVLLQRDWPPACLTHSA